MSYKKSVVEEALYQIKNLEETLQENAKGILQSTMSEEIRQLVKESLKEQEEVDDETLNIPPSADDVEMDDEDVEMDDEDIEMDDEDLEMDDEDIEMGDDETIDMTTASDAEVLKVFKAMGDEDGIVIKKEGSNINLKDGDKEYMIRLGESNRRYSNIYEDMDMDTMGYDGLAEDDDVFSDEDAELYLDGDSELEEMYGDNEDEDSVVYEIEMGDNPYDTNQMDKMMEMYDDEEDEDSELEEMYGDNEDEDSVVYEIEMGDKPYDTNQMDKMMEMYDDEEDEDSELEEMYGDEEDYSETTEMFDDEEDGDGDENFDRMMEAVKKSLKSKGSENRKGPKFSYDKKPNMGGGFNEKRKEAFGKGIKATGTGKPKFEYKSGENMEKGSMKKVETKEASRTYGNGSRSGRGLRKAITPNRNLVFGKGGVKSESVENEVNLLRDKNQEYRKALDIFRTKLNEVAVFNSNLAYATRLFTEHSTTKQEKINILKRFDNVEALKESKNLYRTIKTELNSGNSSSEQKINESIERTVNRTVETGSSANLIESKTYENPQFLRMKDLMIKIK
jgi:hypothetical protein